MVFNISQPFFDVFFRMFYSHLPIHKIRMLLLMEQILHQLIGSFVPIIQGFIHPMLVILTVRNVGAYSLGDYRGHSITNPNNALFKGNPSKLPYICIV